MNFSHKASRVPPIQTVPSTQDAQPCENTGGREPGSRWVVTTSPHTHCPLLQAHSWPVPPGLPGRKVDLRLGSGQGTLGGSDVCRFQD